MSENQTPYLKYVRKGNLPVFHGDRIIFACNSLNIYAYLHVNLSLPERSSKRKSGKPKNLKNVNIFCLFCWAICHRGYYFIKITLCCHQNALKYLAIYSNHHLCSLSQRAQGGFPPPLVLIF